MAKVRRFLNNFTSGEIAPSTYELYNLAKRDNGLATLRNCTIIPAGGLERRHGTRYVADSKNPSEKVRLIPFVFSRTQAYVLALGTGYIRFFRNEGQLVSGGLPVEVSTPYSLTQVSELDYAQNADTIVFTHADVAPQILQRFSDTSWSLRPMHFQPPPTEIKNFPLPANITITPGMGNTYSIVSSASVFFHTDVGRRLSDTTTTGVGTGVVTAYVSAVEVTVNATIAFTSFSLASGEWELSGSPLGTLLFTDATTGLPLVGNQGDFVSNFLYKTPAIQDELVLNNDWATGDLTSWTDGTGRTIATDAQLSGRTDNLLVSAVNQDFSKAGVQTNHLVVITLAAPGGTIFNANVVAVVSASPTGLGANADDVLQLDASPTTSTSDAFVVKETSFVKFPSAGGIELHTGANGVAAISQSVTGHYFWKLQYEFVIEHDACSFRIGFEDGSADIVESTLLVPGKHTGTFSIPRGTSTSEFPLIYLTIENNQFNTYSRVVYASIKNIHIDCLERDFLEGEYIRANGGVIRFTEAQHTSRVNGLVIEPMDDALDALPGAWTIEDSQWAAGTYPEHVAFYQGRLVFSGGTKVWGSAVTNILSFSSGVAATDSFQFTPAANQVNPPHWIVGESVLILGTRAEEYVVKGTDTSFISPTDIDVSSPTAVGSEPVKPVRINQAVVFVKGGGKRLAEFNLDSSLERVSRDLSVLASHLIPVGDRIFQLAWQEEPNQQLWCITQDGLLFSLTYVREQDIWGWARHDSLDGAIYQSVAVIPNPDADRDQVWFSVRRPGRAQDLIEYMDDEGGLIVDYPKLTTDGTIRYSGASVTTISGIAHLKGQDNVWVVDSQGSQGPLTVTAGGSVSFQRAVTEADVGVNYIPEIVTLRPSVDQKGPTGLLIGNTNLFIALYNTGDGITANGKLLKLRKPTDPMDSRITPFTGDLEIPSLGTDRQATVSISQTTPEAFNLLSVAGTLEIENI